MRPTPRPLERMLQIIIAGMMVLATLLFGIGHRSPLLAWTAALAAAAAVYFADITGRFRLNRLWANALSVLAVVVWLIQSLVMEGDWQLVAVTYVLLILQIILLFQAKSDRVYWQLVVLSVAQAAVASALTPGIFFAFILLGYTVLGILALALLLMRRELARFGKPALAAATGSVAEPQNSQALGPIAVMLGGRSSRPTLSFTGNAAELPEVAWRRTLARQAAAIAIGTVLTTLFVFLLFPRIQREHSEYYDESIRSVGFSTEVTLGEESGAAEQNMEPVMRLELVDEPSGKSFQLSGDPLLRGSVATEYTRGRWRQSRSISSRPMERIQGDNYVLERITIEPLDDVALFGIVPSFGVNDDERIRIDFSGDEFVRRRGMRGQRMEYELATPCIHNHHAPRLVPAFSRYSGFDAQLLQLPKPDEQGNDPLAGLKAAAQQVKEQANLPDGDRMGLARALERYLRESGQFEYTLDGQKRTSGLDPLEDFVVEHRRGHCEYFAGALALMLRSQGIPARVAIGFRTEEWNSAGQYYLVRQMHAHTWVEALLKSDEYGAPQDLPPEFARATAAWLILDPTPAGSGMQVDKDGFGLWPKAWMYVDYLQVLWGKYVAALDAKSQQESIYEPLAAMLSGLVSLFDPDTWRSLLGWLASMFWAPVAWYRRNLFSWQGALSTALLLLAGSLAFRGATRITHWWRARPEVARRSSRKVRTSESQLYLRLEQALARFGLRRLPGQTPYEFALSAGGELAERIDHIPLASLPRRVVEAFYRVRFGGRPLDNSEAEAVEHALCALEQKQDR